jgi:hypothetical protein
MLEGVATYLDWIACPGFAVCITAVWLQPLVVGFESDATGIAGILPETPGSGCIS